MNYVENPHIAGAARAEHADMARELMARYAQGEDFFVARDAVMAEHGPRMTKLYGKDVAQRAMNALCSYGPHQLPADTQQRHHSSSLDTRLRAMDFAYGGRHSYSDDQRQAIWMYENGKVSEAIEFGAIGLVIALGLVWWGWMIAAISIGILSAVTFVWGLTTKRAALAPPHREGPPMSYAEIEAHQTAWLNNLTEKQIRADEARRQQEAEEDARRQEERENRAALSRALARMKKDQQRELKARRGY